MQIGTSLWNRLLRSSAGALSIHLDDRQIKQMAVFCTELMEFNQRFNITSIMDPEEIIKKHLVDSLMPEKFIPENAAVLDIGAGGGLPGIPLKIYRKSLSMVLIDASRKKTSFLRYVIRRLNLQNITAEQIRAESLAKPSIGGRQFDVVISRAVAPLERLIFYAIPVLKGGGLLVAMKGKPEKVYSEIDEIACGSPDIYTEPYRLPVSGDQRCLILVRKPLV